MRFTIEFRRMAGHGLLALALACSLAARATENVPHRPFAQWADLPEPGQLVVGLVYEESEAYHIWADRTPHDITVHAGGEKYGIDINQGYVALQYGIKDRWALDLNVGGTSAGWRSFSRGNSIESTTGIMDWSFGVLYRVFQEDATNAASTWLPTVVFRAGAVLPGTFDENFAFAPGTRSAAIEPELLVRKHFGWPGLGAYADALFRWNRTTANDQYITTVGLFQQVQRWELDVGYRHLQSVSGDDIRFTPPIDTSLVYPRDVREINDAIEAGFSYTTLKRHIRFGFHSRTVFDGSNTDRKFWVGGSIDIPIGLKKQAN
jgi:hypothetical protein